MIFLFSNINTTSCCRSQADVVFPVATSPPPTSHHTALCSPGGKQTTRTVWAVTPDPAGSIWLTTTHHSDEGEGEGEGEVSTLPVGWGTNVKLTPGGWRSHQCLPPMLQPCPLAPQNWTRVLPPRTHRISPQRETERVRCEVIRFDSNLPQLGILSEAVIHYGIWSMFSKYSLFTSLCFSVGRNIKLNYVM